MGFLGLFIGPVLMALLVAIWREWLREVEMMDEQALGADEGNGPPQIEAVPKARKFQAG